MVETYKSMYTFKIYRHIYFTKGPNYTHAHTHTESDTMEALGLGTSALCHDSGAPMSRSPSCRRLAVLGLPQAPIAGRRYTHERLCHSEKVRTHLNRCRPAVNNPRDWSKLATLLEKKRKGMGACFNPHTMQ